MADFAPLTPNATGSVIPSAPVSTAQTVAQNTAATVPNVNPNISSGVAYSNPSAIPTAPISTAPKPLPVSTTTLSNANKQSQVPAIQSTTSQLANTGISTNSSGTPVYANGTIVPDTSQYYKDPATGVTYTSIDVAKQYGVNTNAPTTITTPVTPTGTTTPTTSTTTTGGYSGDVYYAPGSTIPNDANGNPVSLTATSPTDDKILNSLNDEMAKSDSMTTSIIQSIKSQYDQLIKAQQTTNAGQEAGVNNALLMGGVTGSGSSSQYAPISSSGIIQAQISYGLGQIADLNNKEAQAIVAAQQAGQNANFQLQDKINAEISKIRDTKVAAATKLNDVIAEQNKKMSDNKIQQTKDTFIAGEMANGTKDAAQILKDATAKGLVLTADEVATGLKNLGPTADELNRQQAAIKFALDNGVTKSFYLVGNTAIDTKTGLPVSLADYQKATGQTGKSEAETDFSQIQTLALPGVQKLIDKYPDAKILPTDTLDQATAKLGNSRIYQKENYIAKSSSSSPLTTVGGNGIVAGVQVPAAISGDVEDVLSGRNTLYNIRQTMGRTNAAAAYMQSMRDAIHKIDPNFDFVASDAGGKFVSSTYYQKAASAINSVLPNINKIVDLSNQVSRIGVKGVDSLLQGANLQIGNQKVSNFREAQKLIADEIGVALGAGSVSDMKLQLGFDVTDPSVTPEVFASNMGIVKDFINNRLQGLKDQRYSSSVDLSSGSSGTTQLIGPDNKPYDVPNDQVDAFIKAGGHR